MSTFKDLRKLRKKDEDFFKKILKENEKDFKIILPLNFEVKESPRRKIEGFSLLKVILIGEFLYSIYYLLDAETKKGFFYFYYKG